MRRLLTGPFDQQGHMVDPAWHLAGVRVGIIPPGMVSHHDNQRVVELPCGAQPGQDLAQALIQMRDLLTIILGIVVKLSAAHRLSAVGEWRARAYLVDKGEGVARALLYQLEGLRVDELFHFNETPSA